MVRHISPDHHASIPSRTEWHGHGPVHHSATTVPVFRPGRNSVGMVRHISPDHHPSIPSRTDWHGHGAVYHSATTVPVFRPGRNGVGMVRHISLSRPPCQYSVPDGMAWAWSSSPLCDHCASVPSRTEQCGHGATHLSRPPCQYSVPDGMAWAWCSLPLCDHCASVPSRTEQCGHGATHLALQTTMPVFRPGRNGMGMVQFTTLRPLCQCSVPDGAVWAWCDTSRSPDHHASIPSRTEWHGHGAVHHSATTVPVFRPGRNGVGMVRHISLSRPPCQYSVPDGLAWAWRSSPLCDHCASVPSRTERCGHGATHLSRPPCQYSVPDGMA